jgi:hypothetical protein
MPHPEISVDFTVMGDDVSYRPPNGSGLGALDDPHTITRLELRTDWPGEPTEPLDLPPLGIMAGVVIMSTMVRRPAA